VLLIDAVPQDRRDCGLHSDAAAAGRRNVCARRLSEYSARTRRRAHGAHVLRVPGQAHVCHSQGRTPMKPRLVQLLACPGCHTDLLLDVATTDGEEIIEGRLTCSGCGAVYPVHGGIPRFTEGHSRGHAATARAFGFQWKRYS